MGKIILFTGGVRSGKSKAAQREAKKYNDVAYVATAVAADAEMEDRIARHRASRPEEWLTLESPYDIAAAIKGNIHGAYLIDCITVFINNLLFDMNRDWDNDEALHGDDIREIENGVLRKIDELVIEMNSVDAVFIVVTNEVGWGVAPYYPLGRIFRDVAGIANQKLAAAAHTVYLTVSGIPVRIKGPK